VLTGLDGILKQLTKTVLSTVLNQEMKPMPTTERELGTGVAWPASSSPRNRCRSSRGTWLPRARCITAAAPPRPGHSADDEPSRRPRRTRCGGQFRCGSRFHCDPLPTGGTGQGCEAGITESQGPLVRRLRSCVAFVACAGLTSGNPMRLPTSRCACSSR